VSIDGNTLPRTPEWVSNLVLRYSITTDRGEWYFQTDWAYRDEISFFLYESEEFQGDALLEGGVNMGYMTDHWEVSVYGRNITDEDALVAAIDFNSLEGIVNDPLTYGVELSYRF
jgi:iron complex outermembrane receptor protein